MADTLGLHVAPEGITAVQLDAVQGTAPVVIGLGDDGPATACLVAQGEGGAVLVGEAARGADGPAVTDPLGRAAGGRIGALGAVINHVVGRAATATGSAARRLAVVVPDDFDGGARDQIVAAGAAAGIADTVAVPISAARAQAPATDAVVAIAAGAARVASLAAGPLVTREDLGETITSKPPVTPPIGAPTGSVSVFEPDEPVPDAAPAPARPAPTPVGAAPVAATPPRGTPPVAPEPEPLRYEPPSHRISGGAIMAVVLIGLIAAVGGALLFLDAGDDSTVTDDPVASSTSTAPTTTEDTVDAGTTTASPTTTGSDGTTSTEATPTTTEPPTTTESTTTTTTPVPVGTPGEVTLVETGLQLDGNDLVLFEQDADVVVAALTAVLGEPDRDDGYEQHAFCLGERTRLVAWGDLELVFTEDELDSGVGRFTQWFAGSHDDPPGLVTFSGVGVTATVAFLELTFGDALVLVQAIPDDPTGLFAATNPGSGALLNGTTTSRDPDGTVVSLWAGDSCTRIFT
jgi:hypothetical protein